MSDGAFLRWGDRALEFGDPIWLWLAPGALLLLILAGRAIRLTAGSPPEDQMSPVLIQTATALRVGAYLALVAALAGATLVRTLREDRIEAVAVLDASRSISAEEKAWMDGWLQNFDAQLRSDDRLAVLAFGRNPVVQVPPGPPGRVTEGIGPGVEPLLDPDATDLAAALGAATDLATGRGPTGVIALLTDGNETEGQALVAADEARRRGVRVFPFSPPRNGPPLSIERASGPSTARAGAEATVSVAISNRSAETRRAEVVLHYFDKELGRVPVEVGPGGAVLDAFFRVGTPGHKTIAVSLEGDRGVVAPGQRKSLPLTVFGPPRVLVVAPNASLGELLREAGFAVERRADLKGLVADDLSVFHAVVIGGASARDLPTAATAELERWVEEFGGGLVLAAASGLVGDESLEGSPLARLLPVGIERQEPKRRARLPLSLFLVIDRSSSMTGGLQADQMRPSRISYARDAALALLEQLEDRDWVGAAAFDTETSPLANLAPLTENRDELAGRIAGLVPSGGTDFKDAVELAVRQLVAGPAQSRHIILLTDGASIRPRAEHDPLIAELAASDVTVTSIRIGEDAEGFDLIESISSSTGGNFHHVTDSDSLPDLMIREARRTAKRDEETAGPGAIRPVVRREGIEALGGLRSADLPPLQAFADVPLREGAEEWLGVDLAEKSAPILAAWQIGLGRVAVFTANPSRLWQSWEKSRRFWSQLIRWTGRATSDDEVRVVRRGGGGAETIEIETFDRHPDSSLAIRLFDRAGGVREIRPVATSPRQYTIGLSGVPALEPRIEIDLERGGRPAFTRDAWLPLEAGVPVRSEDPLADPDRLLLREIARRTGGAVDAPAARILSREPAERRSARPLDRALLLAAFLLLLADITLRQLPRA